MLYSRHKFYLAPDTGGGNSGDENADFSPDCRGAGVSWSRI